MEHTHDAAATAAMPTLADALTRYRQEITPTKKGAKQERNRIGQLLQLDLAALPMDKLKGSHFAAYRDKRRRAGLSASTVRNELNTVSHVYTIARTEWGFEGLPNPIEEIRKPELPPGRDRRLADGEEELLLSVAEPELGALIVLTVETAMRRSEIARLTWPRVDFAQRIAHLPDTKNGTARTVPLSPRAIAALHELERYGGERVCPYAADSLSRAFRRACARAGIKNLRFHDLRHEATSRLLERGFSETEVSEITGHKSLSQLKRYTHHKAARLARKLAETAASNDHVSGAPALELLARALLKVLALQPEYLDDLLRAAIGERPGGVLEEAEHLGVVGVTVNADAVGLAHQAPAAGLDQLTEQSAGGRPGPLHTRASTTLSSSPRRGTGRLSAAASKYSSAALRARLTASRLVAPDTVPGSPSTSAQ